MATDPLLGLTLMPSETLKNDEVYNGNLVKQNALVRQYAISRGVADPTSLTPSNGDVYIIPDGSPAPGDVWAGRENAIAVYYNGWRFQTALAGMTMWVADESAQVIFTGSVWQLVAGGSLASLSDVDFSGSPALADGNALIYDGASSPPVWRHGSAGSGARMDNMLIVDKSSTQSVTSATNTIITWNRDVHDPNGAHDPVTNNSRLTAWGAATAWYRLKFMLHTDATATQIRFQSWLALNRAGSTTFFNDFPRLQREHGRAAISGSNGFQVPFEGIIQLDPGDYVELGVWISQTGGTTIEADNSFAEMEYLQAA